MRVAHITTVFPPAIGGIGTAAFQYANGLSKKGLDVEVFCPLQKRAGKGVRQNFLRPWLKWGHAALMPQLMWRLKGFDVIHVHYPSYGAVIPAVIASRLHKTPLIITYHMKTKAAGWLGLIFAIYRRCVEERLLSGADVVLVSSRDYASSIGLSHKNLTELPFIAPKRRDATGRKAKASEIIFVGGLDDAHYFKGVDKLIRALKKIENKNWRTKIVGEGNRRQVYQDLVKGLDLEDRIIFTGRLDQEELDRAYQNANVHVLPSIDRSEAFGIVTLEAMAASTASIVSNLPGVRTLVDHGRTGMIIEPGSIESLTNALRWIIDHPKKRKEFGVNAQKKVEKTYDEQRVIDRLTLIYKAVK